MAVNKNLIAEVRKFFGGIIAIGRKIRARRFLFVWSAVCVGMALFFGIFQSIEIYTNTYVTNVSIFVFTRLLETVLLFVKLFLPMFMLVMAMKYIFDHVKEKSSETLKVSLFASLLIGILVGIFYYLDATHIIGYNLISNNPNLICSTKGICGFSWPILWYSAKGFFAVTTITFITILGLRGIYKELSFMFSTKR